MIVDLRLSALLAAQAAPWGSPGGLTAPRPPIAKPESPGSRGFRGILDVNSLRTRVGFGIFVTQLADSKPQTPRRGIGDSRDEPGFWMCRASPSPLLNTCCAGRLPILGYPVTKMLEHTLARRAVDAVDFRPSRNGDGIAHSCHRNSRCKRGARCGAGSRTLAFLDPLVWHDAWRKCARQRVA